jgi:hypothetical protein
VTSLLSASFKSSLFFLINGMNMNCAELMIPSDEPETHGLFSLQVLGIRNARGLWLSTRRRRTDQFSRALVREF